MMFSFIGRWWRRRQRNFDRRVLFPEILDLAFEVIPDNLTGHLNLLILVLNYISHDRAWFYLDEWRDEDIWPGFIGTLRSIKELDDPEFIKWLSKESQERF